MVGGGAAGLELVTRLGDTLGRSGRAQVTLVEKARTHLWKPLLHAVAAGSLDRGSTSCNYLAQAHWHNFIYRFGEMIGLDRREARSPAGRHQGRRGAADHPAQWVPYDTLIIAIGSVTNDFGTPGAAQYAVPLETPEQASRFHRRLVNACLRANSQAEPVRPGQLHVAIIGAGATGTELAAELHRTVRAVVAYGLTGSTPNGHPHPPGRGRAAHPARPARTDLDRHHRTAAQDRRRGPGRPRGSARCGPMASAWRMAIPAVASWWSGPPGVKGPEVLADIAGLETTRTNQLVVEPTLQTTRDPDIFAIGDCAACPRPDGKGNCRRAPRRRTSRPRT